MTQNPGQAHQECRVREVRTITGQIEVITGLRIGANVEQMEISGLDNPILRNPATAEPYIPGSSLKGKLRSLAEWHFAELPLPSGELVRDMNKSGRVARVFGVPADKARKVGPTRTLVRDAVLSQADREAFKKGCPITEVKTENAINRLTAMANPRSMERVVAGVRFDYEIIYRVFDLGPDGPPHERDFEDVLLVTMALLEQDYLGSAGSRGYGKIRFVAPDGGGLVRPGVLVDGAWRELPRPRAASGDAS